MRISIDEKANPETLHAANSCIRFLSDLTHLELLGGSDELKRKAIADYKDWHKSLLETLPEDLQ